MLKRGASVCETGGLTRIPLACLGESTRRRGDDREQRDECRPSTGQCSTVCVIHISTKFAWCNSTQVTSKRQIKHCDTDWRRL
jgi:hypothetical protein